MPAADEKIRVAQVALQEAMDEKDNDIRELLLAKARLEQLQKEIATSRPLTPGPVPSASDLEAEVQRLRAQLPEMQAAQTLTSPPHFQPIRIHRNYSFRSTGLRQIGCGQTHRDPGCDRIRRPGVDPRCHGSDPHRCGTAQEVPFHCVQHGDMMVFGRIVNHQCGWLGCRVGEATNPVPRRIRRVLTESSSNGEPLVRPSGGSMRDAQTSAQARVFRVQPR